jgi:hypothetical protein
LERRGGWFEALRTLFEQLDPQRDVLLTVPTTTAHRYVRHGARQFGFSLLSVRGPKRAGDVPSWLRDRRRRRRCTFTAPTSFVDLSPAVADGDPTSGDLSRGSDRLLAETADRLYVLHVRRGGNLHRLLSDLLRRGGARAVVYLALGPDRVPRGVADELMAAGARRWCVDGGREVTSSAKWPSLALSDSPRRCSARIVPLPGDDGSPYLLHWTRRQTGPWPDQDDSTYLNELLADARSVDRSALAALTRILMMQRILATRRLNRGSIPVVSFTARSLKELPELRTFRAHLGRWDFELFGMCISRSWLDRHQVRSVIYGDEQTWRALTPSERPFFQRERTRSASGQRVIDWTVEREWRHLGDVDLSHLPDTDGMVFVPTHADAEAVARISRWPVTVLPS